MKFTEVGTFQTETCYKCGVLFAIMHDYRKQKIEDHTAFYCPNGHSQVYGENDLERENKDLRKSLARKDSHIDQVEADLRYNKKQVIAKKGQITKIKNRIKNGVCPCCNRHFKNLERHILSKHPKFKKNG